MQISQPDVAAVEGEPWGANVKRLITALNYLGASLLEPRWFKFDCCLCPER